MYVLPLFVAAGHCITAINIVQDVQFRGMLLELDSNSDSACSARCSGISSSLQNLLEDVVSVLAFFLGEYGVQVVAAANAALLGDRRSIA